MSIYTEWKAIIETKAPEAAVFLGRRKWGELESNKETETFVFFDIEHPSDEIIRASKLEVKSTDNYLVMFLSKDNIDNDDTTKDAKIEAMKKLARESLSALVYSSATITDVQELRFRLVPIVDQMQGYFTGCVCNVSLPIDVNGLNVCKNS